VNCIAHAVFSVTILCYEFGIIQLEAFLTCLKCKSVFWMSFVLSEILNQDVNYTNPDIQPPSNDVRSRHSLFAYKQNSLYFDKTSCFNSMRQCAISAADYNVAYVSSVIVLHQSIIYTLLATFVNYSSCKYKKAAIHFCTSMNFLVWFWQIRYAWPKTA
jgi:hypothetical protein